MAEPGTLRILLFAGAREAAGCSELALALDEEGAPVEQVLEALLRQCPALVPWLAHLKLAVNGAYARPGERVRPGDEVAVLPPVAGG